MHVGSYVQVEPRGSACTDSFSHIGKRSWWDSEARAPWVRQDPGWSEVELSSECSYHALGRWRTAMLTLTPDYVEALLEAPVRSECCNGERD